jgi:hypothetical protein
VRGRIEGATTSALTASLGVPAVPTGLTASKTGARRILLSWNDVGDAAYFVYRSIDQAHWARILDVTGTSVTDKFRLRPRVTYYYEIVGVSSAGETSAPSNIASAKG